MSSGSKFKRPCILKPSQKIEVVRRLLELKEKPNVVVDFIKTTYNQTVTVNYIQSVVCQYRKSIHQKKEPFSDTGGVVCCMLYLTFKTSLCLQSISWV